MTVEAVFGVDIEVLETLDADIKATRSELEAGAMAAADAIAHWGRARLRADAAPLGPRVQRTWQSDVFPDQKGYASLFPSVTWYSKAPHIVRSFHDSVTVTAAKARWLAIPTENAPKTGKSFASYGRLKRARSHAIIEAERRFGKLRYVSVSPSLALLVAHKARRRRGKRGGYAAPSRTALKRKDFERNVVMFLLVPRARMPKLLNYEAIGDEIERYAPGHFAREFNAILRRHFSEAS